MPNVTDIQASANSGEHKEMAVKPDLPAHDALDGLPDNDYTTWCQNETQCLV